MKRLNNKKEKVLTEKFLRFKQDILQRIIAFFGAMTFTFVPTINYLLKSDEKSIEKMTTDVTELKDSNDLEEAVIDEVDDQISPQVDEVDDQISPQVDELDEEEAETLYYRVQAKQDIMDEYGWTEEEFNIVCAVVLAESKALSYEDACGCISVLMNRTNSVKWNYSADNIFGEGAGRDIYHHVILPGQFAVYSSGAYKSFLPEIFPGKLGGYEEYDDVSKLPGYRAIIDCLISKGPIFNYLNFCACNGVKEGKEQLVDRGNLYYNELEETDKIEELKQEKTLSLTNR